MWDLRKLKKPAQHVLVLLAFLAGAVATYTFWATGYMLLALVTGVGMLRALIQYFVSPVHLGHKGLRLVLLPLDAVSLVASGALIIVGGFVAFYAGLSEVPSTAFTGLFIMAAGAFCGSSLFWRRRAQRVA